MQATSNGAFEQVLPEPAPAVWTGPKWEYLQIVAPTDAATIHQACTDMGQNGWELCGMLSGNMPSGASFNGNGRLQVASTPSVLLQFKRPIQAP